MAVGAYDLAFLDLGKNRRPAPLQHRADVGDLVAKVIEVEHYRIALAAIDAWVG